MVKRIYLNGPWSLSSQFCFVAVVVVFFFRVQCIVYMQFADIYREI